MNLVDFDTIPIFPPTLWYETFRRAEDRNYYPEYLKDITLSVIDSLRYYECLEFRNKLINFINNFKIYNGYFPKVTLSFDDYEFYKLDTIENINNINKLLITGSNIIKIKNLNYIDHLIITNCPNLIEISNINMIGELTIENCPKIKNYRMGHY
jgi:hypothetical protein